MGYSNTTLTPSHQTKNTQNNTLKTPSHHKININTITSQKKHQTLHSHNNTIFDQALLQCMHLLLCNNALKRLQPQYTHCF